MTRLFAAAALGAAVLWASAAAAGPQDFRIVNSTGYDIYSVYVSPSHSDTWEEDVLDRDVLPNNDSFAINFSGYGNDCIWDLMAVYDDGEEVYWEGLDLCSIHEVQLFYNAGDGSTHAVTK